MSKKKFSKKDKEGALGCLVIIVALIPIYLLSLVFQQIIEHPIVIIIVLAVIAASVVTYFSIKKKKSEEKATWDFSSDENDKPAQKDRIERSAYTHIVPGSLDFHKNAAMFIGSTGEVYDTTLNDCTCMDFQKRNLPCKHMYRLANELGVFKSDLVKKSQNKTKMVVLSRVNTEAFNAFLVSGTNPRTGRKNTKHIISNSAKNAIAEAKWKYELTEPFTAEPEYNENLEPTESQVNYAHDLGIFIPDGTSRKDVSVMIDRKLSGDMKSPSNGLANFAFDCGFIFSPYIGKKEMIKLLEGGLEPPEKDIFSIYKLYTAKNNLELDDPRKDPKYPLFVQYAEKIKNGEHVVMDLLIDC